MPLDVKNSALPFSLVLLVAIDWVIHGCLRPPGAVMPMDRSPVAKHHRQHHCQ
jgi:hypothetical protein